MIVNCPNCTTRLQLDDAKVPARPFSVRCPKCQQIINAQPPAPDLQDALAAVADLPVSTRSQKETSAKPAAPLLGAEAAETEHTAASDSEVLRLLASLLQREAGAHANVRSAEQRRRHVFGRRVLVCVGPSYGNVVVRSLTNDGYEVFAADDAAQAMEQMREERVDVLVLDPEFDIGGKGAASVSREICSLRMPERRRVVVVQLTNASRTGDAHAAFLAGANLLVNVSELRELPGALEKNLRELNELYRDFNRSLGLAEL
jgi:predicted Zn finger-like uncharacterized protein